MTNVLTTDSPDNNRHALYLIDGSGFIFRAFHALPRMTRADGTPVNAVYGFCTMLTKILHDLKAEHAVIVFDAGRHTFRNDIDSNYKANRPPPPDDLVPQFSLIREAVQSYGLPAVESAGYEADDLIASYARAAQDKNMDVVVVSADKDLMQLIRDGVRLFDPLKNKFLGESAVIEKFGVTPDKLGDVLALVGDASDNVKGVPGIGVKTAAQLINEYDTLENLLDKAEAIRQPARRAALIANAAQARLARKLVALVDDAPLPIPLDNLHGKLDKEKLGVFLKQQGFKSLLARLDIAPSGVAGGNTAADAATSAGEDDALYRDKIDAHPLSTHQTVKAIEKAILKRAHRTIINDATSLRDWLAKAVTSGNLAIAFRAKSSLTASATLEALALATNGATCVITLMQPSEIEDAPQLLQEGHARKSSQGMLAAKALESIGAVIQEYALRVAVHDLKRLLHCGADFLRDNGTDDVSLLSYVVDASVKSSDVKAISKIYIQTQDAENPVSDIDKYDANEEVTGEAEIILALWHTLTFAVGKMRLQHIYRRLDLPLATIVADMETAGVRIDGAALKAQSAMLGNKLHALESEMYEIVGHEFNPGSPRQLAAVLFDEMKLPTGKKGSSGALSTSHEILEPLAENGHIIAEKVLAWRTYSKLKSTYADALPRQISPLSGRVHTNFNLTGTVTGRLASTEPNLQNIPIRSAEGKDLRRAFVAGAGMLLVSVDYSQLELRLAAAMAEIPAMMAAFARGDDIHKLTAADVFSIKPDAVSADQRRQAKAVNFGILYGIGGYGLAKQLGVSTAEAQSLIKRVKDRYGEFDQWAQKNREYARSNGYVSTLAGRRIHISGLHDKNAARRGYAERQAINAPLQGTAADIMRAAMIMLVPALCNSRVTATLLMQVHDELVLETPKNDAVAVAEIVRETMESVVKTAVPLLAEARIGENWGDMDKIA